MKIYNDSVVTIEYKMVNDKAEVIDTTDNGDALQFIQGRASVFPAIENKVAGHSSGERFTFTLEAKDSFGERDEAKVNTIPKSQFNSEQDIRVGMRFYTEKNSHDLPVIVTAVNDEEITVDANHPLAGKSINVDLVIVDVRAATQQELESGEVERDEDIFNRENSK